MALRELRRAVAALAEETGAVPTPISHSVARWRTGVDAWTQAVRPVRDGR